MSNFVCLYMGRSDECPECGFFNGTGARFCSHDCADHYAARVAAQEVAAQARRDREDAFATAGEELRAAGHADEEIDVLLVGMPT